MARALLVMATVLVLAGCGGKEDASPPPRAEPAAPPADAVLAAWSDTSSNELFWADGRTLEPVDGRSVALSYFYSAAERSPDGRTLAVGAGERSHVQLVDLGRMRPLGTIAVGASGFVERLHWVAPDLLLASLGGLPARAVALDPATQEILSIQELEGTVLHSQPRGDELVFLLAPADRIGPARLAVFDGRGLRTAELREIRAGWEEEGNTEEDYRARHAVPGLAVEPSGRRALVVPAGRRVAEVDLETLEVRYHDLAEPVSLLGRLRNWLEPAAHAKSIDGPDRNAVWLPSGLVAVSGADYADEGGKVDVTPAGLSLIDPTDWSVRTVSDEPTWVAFRGGALLASSWGGEEADAQEVVVLEPDGTPRFTLARKSADLSQLSGEHLYVATEDGARYEIVDLATGETVGRAAPKRAVWLVHLD